LKKSILPLPSLKYTSSLFMKWCCIFCFFIGCLIVTALNAQPVVANFNITSSACLQQNLQIQNQSTNALTYEWDFCLEDIKRIKSSSNLVSIPNLNFGANFKLVNDSGNWFGFALSENNNRIMRLDFGNSLLNTPSLTDLGNPGNALIFPEGIDFVKSNGRWFAFIGHFNFGGGIVRLDFGASLSNSPAASNVGDFGYTVRFRDLKIVNQGGSVILLLSNYNQNSLVRVNFGTDVTTTNPSVTDTGPLGSVFLPLGFDVAKKGSQWIVLLNSFGTNETFQLNFGMDILSSPTVEAQFSLGVLAPRNLKIFLEGNNYYTLISNDSGILGVFDFGSLNPLVNPANLNLSSLPNAVGLDVVRVNGQDALFSVPSIGQFVTKIVFEADCGASNLFSLGTTPAVYYNVAGIKSIELVARNNEEQSSFVQQVSVSSLASPVSSIATNGFVCANSQIILSATPISNIQTFSWDFGDGQQSNGTTVSHQYLAGSYVAKLSLLAANGCTNYFSLPLQIFSEPQANFTLPAVPTICTNQNYGFANISTFDSGSNPSWQWSINGVNIATSQNLTTSFASTNLQTINLQASIPGCSSTTSRVINSLVQGPLTTFNAPSDACQLSSVSFSNTTIGSVSSYQWIFGDGNTSASTNASNTYANIGTYQVTLQANNAAGCQNTTTKSITIYSKPQPDFSIGLPPFSCAGTPSQFTDQTPAPNDSNIAAWQWAFGDPASGTSNTRNPTYIYSTAGVYNVSLTATTNFGCSNTIQKAVTISASPQAAFTNSVACVSQPTQFTDGSSGSIRSRLWTIQGNSFTTPNVQFAFVTPGSYPVLLTVTGNNNCTSQAVKNIVVPVLPTLDFSVQAACNTNPTLFSEITSGADAPQSQTWNFASLGTGTGAAAQFTFSTPGNYAVQLRSTRQSGCVYSVTKNVSVIQGPVADFTPSVDVGGPPLPVNFVNTSTGATSYLWRFGDAANTTSTAVNPSFTFSDLGIYAVKLTASNATGCSFTTSKPITVLVPNINLVLSDFRTIADASGILQPTVSIFNNGNLPVTNPDLLIDVASAGLVRKRLNARILPNQTISVPVDLQIVPRSADYICAELVVPNNTADFDKRRCLPLGSEEILFAPYPNPAADILNFDWVSIQARSVSVIVFSPGGGEVFRQRFESIATGLNRLQIKTTELPNGLYYILYSDGSTTKSFSFAIAKN
jgi:PKD repeat protein